MSVSKWAYSPERCDGEVCVGDCDLCPKAKSSPSNIWMKIGEHIGEIMNLLFEDTTEMTTEEAIDQLASMRCHAEDMRDAEDEKSVWAKDIQAICMAIDALKKQPKPGRWIANVDRWGDTLTTVNGYRCSECKAFNTYKDNYCPNCGAKMEDEE